MKFSWNQRTYKAVRTFISHELIDEGNVQLVKRALYFGQYRWALLCSPDVTLWTEYVDILNDLQSLTKGTDHRLVTSQQGLYFNLYSDDPALLGTIRRYMSDKLEFQSIRVIHESCWHIVDIKPKNKGPFYHKFEHRVRVKEPIDPSPYKGLMIGEWFVNKNLFYCHEVRDLVLFRLMNSQDIVEITERS